jgi:hypothetical protein
MTAGFGYTFFNEKLRDYSFPDGYDEFSGHAYDMQQPLIHQPGEAWEYGVSQGHLFKVTVLCPYAINFNVL